MKRRLVLLVGTLLIAATFAMLASQHDASEPLIAKAVVSASTVAVTPPRPRPTTAIDFAPPKPAPEPAAPSARPEPRSSYASLRFCLRLNRAVEYFAAHPERLDSGSVKPTAPDVNEYARQVRAAQRAEARGFQEIIRNRDSEKCPDATSFERGEAYAIALDAARRGDREAARCYVFGILPGADAIAGNPASLAEYRTQARRLMDDGILAGDWGMVQVARYSEHPRTRGLLRTLSSGPGGEYKYAMLQYLGSVDPDLLADGEIQVHLLSQTLTPEQKMAADAWARSTYLESFAGRAPYSRTGETCNL